MKARFFAVVELLLGLAACQNEPTDLNVGVEGDGLVTISVTLPDDATRAGGADSAVGAIGNVDLGEYDIRYILEVYDASGNLAKERLVNFEDTATTTAFDLRLIPGRKYSFVVWADFVEEVDVPRDPNGDYDNYYETSAGLTNVSVETDWVAMEETRDAYTGVVAVDNFSSAKTINIPLTRPFAKMRVVTTDIEDLFGIMPKQATVKYTSKLYTSFNALTATAGALNGNIDAKVVDLTTTIYTNDDTDNTGKMTLFADYFFGAENDVIKFTMDVVDSTNQTIPTVVFSNDIPVARNYLTTIVGPILTDSGNITVTIDSEFTNQDNLEDKPYYIEIWDGKTTNAPRFDNERNAYIIEKGSELAWLADQVNGVTRAANNTFKGKTFLLDYDIDLGGNAWTPIGTPGAYSACFAGILDGQGHQISNLRVNNAKGAALIGGMVGGAVKNLTIDNAELTSNHYAAGIVAWSESGSDTVEIEKCCVKNAKINVVPELVGGKWDNGDKAGAIAGFAYATYVDRCSVENVEVTAFRDVAAVVGYSKKGSITNCSAKDATVTADQTHEYKEEADGNAGVIVGRVGDPAPTMSGNSDANVTVIRKVDQTKEFEYALADRRNEDVIYVGEGEVVLPASLAVSGINTLTIEGLNNEAAVQFNKTPGGADGGLNCYANGTDLIFKNIKVISHNTGSAYTGGFGNAKSVLFDNCYYEGQYRSLSYVKFNECTIDPKTSYIYTDYSNADFVKCTFNCSEGKGIQVYNDGSTTQTVINIEECNFTAAKHGATWDGKPVTAIDIYSNGEKFTVNINKSTATDFPEGEYTGETMFNIKGGAEHIEVYLDGNKWIGKGIITDDEGNLVVNSLLTLETALESAGAAGAGDTNIVFAENTTLDMTGVEWTPIKVDGYHGADIVTVDGKGSVIKGLTSSLFAGGFAGGSGIIIKNLTIEDSAIVADNTQGYGAFVNNADSMDIITLENCHLINSSIITPNDGANDSRIGGLIGWTSGYNDTSDGPVDSFITVKNCSVVGCTLKGCGSIGGICGHAGANPATYTTIENCTIMNNNLISTDSGWRVGVVVGTANVGEVTINNITESGNTLTQTGETAPEGVKRDYYGRFVPGSTGKLVIDGEEVVFINSAEKLAAVIENAKAGDTITIDDNITLTENVTIPAGVTFNGNGKQINGTLIAGGDITFAGHTKVTAFSAGFNGNEITIGEEACLEITGADRTTTGWNNTFNITGTIADAKSADKANIKPSLIMPKGISITGSNGLELNIKNAYVQIGNASSKNSAANGTFTINIENSIAEFTNQLTFSTPTNGMNPTFNLNIKNSVVTTATKLILSAENCNMVVDNSTVDITTYFRNSGNVELKNGSKLTGATIQFDENGGHDGKTTVDNSEMTISASSAGHAYDGQGTGEIILQNGANVAIDYYKDLTITTDATSTFTGTQVM